MNQLLVICLIVFFQFTLAYSEWRTTSKPVKLIGGDGEAYMRPVWSPNGDWVAFTKDAYHGIWVKHIETGVLKQISDEPSAGYGFSWSNSGEAIVARVSTFEGRKRFDLVKVFELKNDTSWLASPTKSRFTGLPRWTSDDKQVYIFDRRELRVFESGLRLAEKATVPASRQMCYLKSGKIAVAKTAAEGAEILEPIKGKRYINLAISPDDSKLAFEVVGDNMFVMNTNGSGLVDLGRGSRPQWSPDSEYIVYMITKDDGHRYTQSDLYTIKIEGSGKTNLTNTKDILEMNPSWSPNGRWIAFDTYDEGAIFQVEIGKIPNSK